MDIISFHAKITIQIVMANMDNLRELISAIDREFGGTFQHELQVKDGSGYIHFYSPSGSEEFENFVETIQIGNERLSEIIIQSGWTFFNITTQYTHLKSTQVTKK